MRHNKVKQNKRCDVMIMDMDRTQTEESRKWVTQYMLCSVNGFESSKPGRTGGDKGCHVDLGIFGTCLVLQTSVSAVHKRGSMSAGWITGIIHQIIPQPATQNSHL